MTDADRYLDAGVAAAKLAERSGCTGFELAANGAGVWHAWAEYQTKRIAVDGHSTQAGAAIALAERLLRSATCRCLRPVALAGAEPGRCRWRLVGDAWESSCEAPPITMPGQRGDLDALAQVVATYHAGRVVPVDIDASP